jgi:parallel beta-helix repeat protein
LSGNTIIENDEDGIFLSGASSNIIEYNIIRANNGDGIGLQHYFNDFSYGGESRWENSTDNIIRDNSIISNQRCGIFSNSSGNLIYHNNFLDNTPQVIPGGESNTWDNSYPSGGNYWSNYVDTDNYSGLLQNLLGSDGICDHRYVIATGNRDNYPLMSMSFSDEFSTTINDRWMWTNQPQNWQVSSGWLVITPALGTNFWSGVESGQFLCQLMSGNFMIQTKVSTTLSTNYQQAGLMIRQDANNWVKTNLEYSGGLTIKTGTNRNGAASVEKATTLSPGTSLVWLRVVKNGDYFAASYSLNGSTWIQHYSWTQTLHGYLMVGLCVADGDSGVAFQPSFDYFRYSNLVPYAFTKVIDAITYPVSALSNSEITGFSINQSAKMISFNITGATGTSGFCNLTIPRVLLGEPYTVQIDGSYVSPIVMSNSTHTSIYFTYVHSTHVVQIVGATIVAEFTTIASNILVMAVLALVLFLAKRKMAAVDLHKAQ